MTPSIALAIAAHPDDIEFRMAGTLLRLRAAGWKIHYLNLSAGNCGSAQMGPTETARKRRAEAQTAAKLLGFTWHPPFCKDLEITYTVPFLRKLAAVIRLVRPNVVLTHPPVDYMEDHTATCRLAVTAAFSRGMPNFKTVPSRRAIPGDITVYHCTAHGLVDPLNRPMMPEFFIDTTAVHDRKLESLAAHASQQDWLDRSQGMNSYLKAADDESRLVGQASGKFRHAEGWWRHASTGFCPSDADPLRTALSQHAFPPFKSHPSSPA